MATDQEIRDAGLKYIPQQKYLQNPYELPIAPVPTVEGGGITNTNAFTNSGGGGGGALQTGDPMMNFDNYYNYTGNKYMQNQDTPNLDMNYDQKLQSNFMGFPNYQQQELTGPDMGEYIGSGTNIPLEQTMAGKIQSGVQGAGKGIKNLMGMLPTPGNLLNKFGIQNFNSLSPADQLFIKTNTGYRGPTVFGENTGGGNVDPFGLNVESAFGNYAGAVRDNFSQLQDTLNKDRGAVTFNEVTGMFEGEDEELVNRQNKNTKMIRKKFLFRKKQIDQQKKNQRDIDKKAAQDAAIAAAANRAGQIAAQKGADEGVSGGGRGSRRGDADISESSRGGFATDDTAGFFAKGGRAGYFFGGRVNFKDGGLASIL
jgi:hypothetical protein